MNAVCDIASARGNPKLEAAARAQDPRSRPALKTRLGIHPRIRYKVSMPTRSLPLLLLAGLLVFTPTGHSQTPTSTAPAARPSPTVAAPKPVLIFSATRRRLESEGSARGNEMVTEEQWVYDVTIENRSFSEARALEIEYRVFVFDDRGRSGDRRQPMRKSMGSTTIESIPRSGKASFQTEPQRIVKTQLQPDWNYLDGRDPRSADRLKGLWIQVKQNGQLVAEYINPTTLKDKERWEMAPPVPGKPKP